ncbi:MAG: hypothetical protein AUJ51_02590, partial [Elusimicrobia bacterium CG1_02_56_21]
LDIISTGTAVNIYAQIWRDGSGTVVATVTSQGYFYGNGSGLTGISASDATKLPLAGGIMTGQLTNTSSVTITGNGGGPYGLQVSSNVSLAGALYSANGNIGVGTTNPNSLNAGTKLMISGTGNPGFDMNSTDGTGYSMRMYEAGAMIGDITANSGNMYFDSQNGSAVHLRADPDYLGASNLYLETGKAQRLTILGGGNVGIGTVSPAEKLDVAGVIRSTNTIYPGDGLAFQSIRGISDDALNYRTVFSSSVYMVGYSSAAKYYGDGSGLTNLTGTDVSKLPLSGGFMSGQLTTTSTITVQGNAFSVGGSTLVVKNGKVGIGTTVPLTPLDVRGVISNGDADFILGKYDSRSQGSNTGNRALAHIDASVDASKPNDLLVLNFQGDFEGGLMIAGGGMGSGTPNLYVSAVSPGNVGIGTVTPGEKLDVAGVIRSTGAIYPGTGLNFQSNRGMTDDASQYRTVFSSNVYIIGYSSAAKYYGDGSGLTGVSASDATKLPLAGGVLTGNLTMGGNNIYTASTITASGDITAARYQINGSTMVAILPGTNSIAYGVKAGAINTGNYNVFIGNSAGASNTTGNYNTANGYAALYSNTTGGNNTANGYAALYYNTTGGNNTANGYYALFNNQTGSANSITGYQAGYGAASSSFSSSTLMGYQAGFSLVNGSADNLFLGFQAGYAVTTGTGNIVIGYNKGTSAPAANNELNIGGVLYGDLSAKTIGISTRVPQAALDIVSTGTVQTQFAQIWRNSGGTIISSVSATGVAMASKFVGDGSALTGVSGSDATKLPLSGGVLAGDLEVGADSTMTVTGNAFSVGGSTFVVTAGHVGINWSSPDVPLVVNSVAGEAYIAKLGLNGVTISTGGAIQTTGIGYGTVSGNARGEGATDLQTIRGAATQVAGGKHSTIAGGHYNTASGLYSAVPGGSYNTASAPYSFAAGYGAQSTAQSAFTWQDSGGWFLNNNVQDRTVFKSKGGFIVTGSTNTNMLGNIDRGIMMTGNGMLGISTGAPQAALDIVSTGTVQTQFAQIWRNSGGIVISSVSATGVAMASKFVGDGSGLTGVSGSDATKLPLAG